MRTYNYKYSVIVQSTNETLNISNHYKKGRAIDTFYNFIKRFKNSNNKVVSTIVLVDLKTKKELFVCKDFNIYKRTEFVKGETVLVKNTNDRHWFLGTYSHYCNDTNKHVVSTKNKFELCKKYEGK